MSFVSFGIVGKSEDIVRGYLVKIRQPDQNISWNIPLAQLVVAVDTLGAVQYLGELPLLQIPVLPKIFDSLIHGITPWIGYHSAICSIDRQRKMRYTIVRVNIRLDFLSSGEYDKYGKKRK